MPDWIEIEDAFDECVRSMGGQCVRDLLPGDPGFPNADYIFREVNVVAELKCLEHDPRKKPGFQQRLRGLLSRWVSEGRMPPLPKGTTRIDTQSLPPEVRREFVSLFRPQVQSAVKKASRQIKSTIDHFDLQEARGLLLVANDGHSVMHPAAAFYFLHHILKSHEAINGAVYFTANVTASVPDCPEPALVWGDVFVDGRERIPQEFLRSLSEHWQRALENRRGERLRPIRPAHATAEMVEAVRLREEPSK